MSEAGARAPITIRPAVPEDAEGIARTFAESAAHHAQLDPECYYVPAAEMIQDRYREGRTGTMKFEAGPGGRLVEMYPGTLQQPFVVGRILIWAPGERLVFEWRQSSFAPNEVTEVEVRFDAVKGGTRVTIQHRGWDAFPPQHKARLGYTGEAFTSMIGLLWADLLTAFRSLCLPPTH
jgi:uncharacterized protein YndB with AHSA1/START domain